MSFARLFKLSSDCLIASGFAAIVVTGAIGPLWGCIYGLALVVSWVIDTAALRRKLPGWLLNGIILSYLPIAFLDYKIYSQSLVLTAVHLALFAAVVKLLTLASDADHAYLYCISFSQLLAASVLTVNIAFAVVLVLFLFSGVSTLTLYEMKRSSARAMRQGVLAPVVSHGKPAGKGLELFSSFPARTVAWLTIAMGLLILVLAAPLFLLLPRLALGVYASPSGETRMVSGFSEHVELGTIGTIKESDAVVMHVKPEVGITSLPANLKWRGIALDYYDGHSWRRSPSQRRQVIKVEGRFFKIEQSIQGTQLQELTFFLEALSTNVVFAPHKVLAVSAELGLLEMDGSGNLFTRLHPFNKIRYRAQSDVTPPAAPFVWTRPGQSPSGIRTQFLQLPPLDPRTALLARRITAGLEGPYEKARAIESYLLRNYGYSLELKGTIGHKDPLAMFLFEVKRGHCEYFATAMVVMLREIGIPARLVNGFRAGEYNRLGSAFTVRQYDAHSWVEAFMPPLGWIEFDPTPPDPARNRTELTRVISDLIDAANLWWWEGVVNYDVWAQFRLLSSTYSSLTSFQRDLRRLVETSLNKARASIAAANSVMPPVRVLVFLGALLALCVAVLLWLHASHSWTFRVKLLIDQVILRVPLGSLASKYYKESLVLLEKKGVARDRAQTPLEFATTLHGHPAGKTFMELTRVYNHTRFGGSQTATDLDEMARLLARLQNDLARRTFAPNRV